MIVRLANSAYRDELERFLVGSGFRACPTSEDELDVEVTWPVGALRFASVDRSKILAALDEWRRRRPAADVDLLESAPW